MTLATILTAAERDQAVFAVHLPVDLMFSLLVALRLNHNSLVVVCLVPVAIVPGSLTFLLIKLHLALKGLSLQNGKVRGDEIGMVKL